MKNFELLGKEIGPMAKSCGEVRILLSHDDDSIDESIFQALCREIVAELKLRENADNPNLPSDQRKIREEIIYEIAYSLCTRSNFRIVSVDGCYQLSGFSF